MHSRPPDADPCGHAAAGLVDAPGEGAIPLAEALARSGRLPVLHGLALAVRLLATLEHLHATGAVHGAISSATVHVTPAGRIELPWPVGARAGWPWDAPERLAGEVPGPGADLYAAALVAYELLTGTLPFAAPGAAAAWPARVARPALPVAVEAVFLQALAADPAHRHASAGALSAALQRAVGLPAWERRAPVPRRPVAPRPAAAPATAAAAARAARGPAGRLRRRLALAGIAAAAVAVLALGSVAWRPTGQADLLASAQQPPLPAGPAALVLMEAAPTPTPLPKAGAAAPVAARPEMPALPPAPPVAPAPAVQARAAPTPGKTTVVVRDQGAPRRSPVPAPTPVPTVPTVRSGPPAVAATRPLPARVAVAPQCGQPSAVARDVCLAFKCLQAEFERHPVCQRFQAQAEARARQDGLRQAQWSGQ